MHLRHPGAVLLALLAVQPSAVAHDGDLKIVHKLPPWEGKGVRTWLPEGTPRAAAGTLPDFDSHNVTLLSWLSIAEYGAYESACDVWGYVSPSGREYALQGLSAATAFVEVTNPANPQIVHLEPGPSSLWRTVKVYEDRAFVVSEGGGGIQVFDLSSIDAGAVTLIGNVTSGGALETHTLALDAVSGFLYRCGGNFTEGIRFYDLDAGPLPVFVGSWAPMFVHEGDVRTYTSGPYAGRQIAFLCGGFNGGGANTGVRIVDVTDKASPFLVKEVFYPGAEYTHQCWLSDDLQYLYVNDERTDGPPPPGFKTRTHVVDVSDIDNAFYVGAFSNEKLACPHNLYVDGDLLFEANYRSGLRVFDLSVDPLDPPEIAWFDTYPPDDVPNLSGMWTNYPYLPSGIVLASDLEKGLFVFWVGDPLLDIAFDVAPPSFVSPSGAVLPVTITEQSPGDLVSGSETLHYDAGAGYQSVPLVALGGGRYHAVLPALSCPGRVAYYVSARSTNEVVWTEPPGGAAAALEATVASGELVVFADDFETNQGWTATNGGATAGDFVRGVPLNDPSWPWDPFSDSDGSGQCWVTQNTAGNSDVDGGAVLLRSPSLDLSGPNPAVQYDYYLSLNQEAGSDFIRVDARDLSSAGPWIEVARHDESGWTTWTTHLLFAADFAAAGVPLSSSVQVRFVAFDGGTETYVEAGIDAFFVKNLACDPTEGYCTAGTSASGCQAALWPLGAPSATAAEGFELVASAVEGDKDGLFFFGTNGRQANPWGNGTSFQCVVPPVIRCGLLAGTGATGVCDGLFTQDLNALWCPTCPKPAKNPGAGAVVQAQLWYRDPLNTSNQTTSLSNAVEFTVAH
jgi:choice-of-anchor B domain-containing protein